MSTELKLKLKQAAETAWEEATRHNPNPCNPYAYAYGYKAGAQTILENPEEWDLCSLEIHKQAVKTFDKITMDAINAERATVDERNQLQSQLAKYRDALEKIVNQFENFDPAPYRETVMYKIAKEALKQEDATCPKCGYPLFKHLSKTCCQGCDYVKQQ